MIVYLATGSGIKCYYDDDFHAFNALISYHYADKKDVAALGKFNRVMLDSGIFTYLNTIDEGTGKEVDWEQYVDTYADFVRTNNIQLYVEVDVDKLIGVKEVDRLRERLHKRVGWKSIPVWHMTRDYDDWLKMATDYDYICFGAFITDGLHQSKYRAIKKFIVDATKRQCKVHGLGMTSFKHLAYLPFYSVDSVTWRSGERFGQVHQFNGHRITIRTNDNKKEFRVNRDMAHRNNFYEWVKFANYAENKVLI